MRTAPAPSVASLWRQLIALRNRAIVSLARGDALDPGMVSLIGSVAAALGAIDQIPVAADRMERAVVADDGTAIRLRLFRADGTAAEVELDAAHAIGLAGRLAEAAQWRIAGSAPLPQRKVS